MVIEPAFGTFSSVGRCQVLLENEISISIKLVSRRKHEVLIDGCVDCGLQKIQWTNTSRWHGSPNHHWLWKLHTGLQATWILCLSTLPPDSGTLISKWNAKFTFIWKEDFGPLSNSPILFLHSPGKTLLTLSLVQKWLCSTFPEDVWAWWLLMHWLQLQFHSLWSSHKCLNQLCLTVFPQACGHYPVACAPFPTHFFLPGNFAFICFDTALCKQPHLSVMTLCDLPPSCGRASMFIFWIIAKSAVFPHYCGFKYKRYPDFILYREWSLLKLKCKYSNILRYWFFWLMS